MPEIVLYKHYLRSLLVAFGRLAAVLLCACLMVLPPGKDRSLAGTYSPEQVKAAMLIKFTDFITWPEAAFQSGQNRFVIGVLDSPKVYRLLASLSGRIVQGRPLEVTHLDTWPQGDGIHMIYMDSAGLEQWQPRITPHKFILTISDSEAFLKAGGMLCFITREDGRLGFVLNKAALQQSELVFSSSLLRLASIRTYDPEGGK